MKSSGDSLTTLQNMIKGLDRSEVTGLTVEAAAAEEMRKLELRLILSDQYRWYLQWVAASSPPYPFVHSFSSGDGHVSDRGDEEEEVNISVVGGWIR